MEDKEEQNNKPSKRYQLSGKGTKSKAMGIQEWRLALMPICFWGTAFYFVAIALKDMHPATVAWLRITLGFIFFALLPVKSTKHKLDFHDWLNFTILGLTGLGIPLTLFAIAQQWIDSSLAGMLIGAQPIFATMLASLFLKTSPSKKNIGGLCFGLGGIVCAAWPNFAEFDSKALGIILVVTALMCYAFSYNFTIPLTQKFGGYFVNVRILLISSIFTIPYGIYGMFKTTHTLTPYISVLILGIGATALAPLAAALLSARTGATRASSVNFLIPLVALYMGAFLNNEDIHILSLVGLGLILVGLVAMGGADTQH